MLRLWRLFGLAIGGGPPLTDSQLAGAARSSGAKDMPSVLTRFIRLARLYRRPYARWTLNNRFNAVTIALLGGLGGWSEQADAQLTYTYTGNQIFKNVAPFLPEGIVTGTATFGIPENYTGPAGIETCSLTAVGVTVTCTPNDVYGVFEFQNGTATRWFIEASNGTGSKGNSVSTVNGFFNPLEYFDAIATSQGTVCYYYGCQNTNSPGVWTLAGVGASPPVAVNHSAKTNVNTTVEINLAAGAKGHPTSAAPIGLPSNGTVSGYPGTTVIYAPATNYTGSDSFQFTLSNAGGTSNTATASVTVSPYAPVSANETASTQNKTPVSINLLGGSTGGATSAALVGSPRGGTVTGFPSTTVTFTPTGSFSSPWGFQFTLGSQFGSSNTSTATIWPGIVSTETKTFCAGMADGSDQVAAAFEGLSIGLEGGNAKQVAANAAVAAAINVFTNWIAHHDEAFGGAVDLAYGIHEFAEKAVKHFTKTNPLSIAAEVDSLVFSSLNLMANVCVEDPPDENYTVVARPIKLHSIKTGNATVDKLQVDYWTYISLNAAVVHAAERWQGATLAQAPKYVALQLKAYNKYLNDLTAVEATLKADNLTMANAIPTFNINSFPGGAPAMAADFNLQCGRPLPKNLNQELLSVGMSEAQINVAVCSFVNSVTSATISTNAQGVLQSNPFP